MHIETLRLHLGFLVCILPCNCFQTPKTQKKYL